MIKYDKYKPSEIDWLGDIPNDWEVKRVKDLADYQSGYYIDAMEFDNDALYPVYGGNGIRGNCNKYNHFGDYILIGRQGALCGNINYAKDYFWATEHAVVVYKKKNINMNWLGELLRIMNLNQYALSAAQPGLSVDKIKRLELPFVPFETQNIIANFINTKTQAIDKKINLLTQKANYYKEYRKSLINEAVCKGLDKDVKLKDSEVHYINSIAEHWKIERIKDLFDIGRGRVIGQELLVEDGKYPVYSSQTENNGCLGYIETFDFDNDLLTWTTDGANAGTVFRRSGKFNCTNVCGTLIPKRKNLDLDYVVYALQESASHNKRIDTNGAKIMNNEMGVIKIAFPPLSEQTQIANYLDNKTQTIDKIVSNINTQIQTLKELRKTLINDAVTGKIKVTSN
jgi:type I restriction enzyme, S subunit